jgi:hypothetical protein
MQVVTPMVDSPQDTSMAVGQLEEARASLGEVELTDTDELRRIGESLIDLAARLMPLDGYVRQSGPSDRAPIEDKRLGDLARSFHLARSRRAGFLRRELFAEPAWDILLDLFANAVQNRTNTVDSACLAAGVAASTALRWLGILVSEGLIEQLPEDHRPQNHPDATEVRLTPAGFELMKLCLSDAAAVTRL